METGITPTLGVENIALKHVLCNSFGFGGNDTSLLFSVQPTIVNITEGSENEIKILSRVEITSEEE